jgi:phospholipid/cholesterol/gamma-HCH transport system permease protein
MDHVPTTRIEEAPGGDLVVHLRGRIDRTQAGSIWRELSGPLEENKPSRLSLDLQEVTAVDTAGVALFICLENFCSRLGTELRLQNISEEVGPFLQYMKEHSSGRPTTEAAPRVNVISRLGEWGVKVLQDAYDFVRFLGDFLAAGPKQLIHPRRLHIKEFFYQTQLVGAGAVPLLVMLSLLLGALMVFQGMNSVTKFGSKVFIADMVVFAVTREMGPLLTAVILAGRTGAAFAAEIGTMKLNEEVDALEVHNFDITIYLVLPRVLALMIAGPLLTMLSDFTGILGGLVTSGAVMHLPAASFLNEAQKVLSPSDIYTGLIKGTVFGAFVGLIGCFRGLQTGLGAGSVGVQTTSAVVTGIFTVIFLDTLFSYIFQSYGW